MNHPLAPADDEPSDHDLAKRVHAAASALNDAIERAAAAGIRTDLTVATFGRIATPDVAAVAVMTAKVLPP